MINGENIVEGIDLKQRKTIVVLANGSKMECTIREFVVGTRILPPEFQSLKFGKKFNDYLHDLHRKLSMDFYTADLRERCKGSCREHTPSHDERLCQFSRTENLYNRCTTLRPAHETLRDE